MDDSSLYFSEMENTRLNRDALNNLSGQILASAICVHRHLGPGLLESVYHVCMIEELQTRKIKCETFVSVQLHYMGKSLNKEYIIDLLVENEIVLELKAAEVILPVHKAQILSYIKLANKRLGLLINFNVPLIKNGFKRFVNKF
jgi:GxxExxY protein